MALVKPHGKKKKLMPLLLEGSALQKELKKAKTLKQLKISSRETADLVMMGIGAFTPLTGFMTKKDWKGVCSDKFKLADGTFWPVPVTLSASTEFAASLKKNEEITLVDEESGTIMATMKVTEKYAMSKTDKEHECKMIFRTVDVAGHPGVQKVMGQPDVNLAGPVKVLSEAHFPETFKGIYMTPKQTRKMFEDKGWSTIAAFQTRNPMHRSHEYLAKIAIETMDGVLIHQILGKLKEGDIPADVRANAIDTLMEKYFVKDSSIQCGYPMEMRYAGPREALLHALFRQNFGCSHLIVGRDHAGVGDYYGPFDAQKIFDEIPKGALETQPLKIDHTFYCFKCDGMASMRTCPHQKEDRLMLSGTKLRKMLSEGENVPDHFSRPEVLEILKKYYAGLTEKVEIKLHSHAEGTHTEKR
jgi:sulfate adenylyltransferase